MCEIRIEIFTWTFLTKGPIHFGGACEGVFGRIKTEMFYNRGWDDVTIDEFMVILDEYLHWYNEKRIKQSLGYMSPAEFRQSLGGLAS